MREVLASCSKHSNIEFAAFINTALGIGQGNNLYLANRRGLLGRWQHRKGCLAPEQAVIERRQHYVEDPCSHDPRQLDIGRSGSNPFWPVRARCGKR